MDIRNDWEFERDRIVGGGGRGEIIGVKPAPDGVAIELNLIYGEGRGCMVLRWNFIWSNIYGICICIRWYYYRIYLKRKRV